MSRLGLGRNKLAFSVSSAVGQEPADKKRKTDDNVAADSAWDDDLDILLTQNMNKLDSLVASTQTAVKNAYGESATSCNDRSHDISSNAANVVTCEVETKCITTGEWTGSSLGKRLIGHGGTHSRSADCLRSSLNASSGPMTRKHSFSTEKSCIKSKEPDKSWFLTSFQNKRTADSLTNGAHVMESMHPADVMTNSSSPVRLDANANCTKTKLLRISEECDYYKAEVCVVLSLVCYS